MSWGFCWLCPGVSGICVMGFLLLMSWALREKDSLDGISNDDSTDTLNLHVLIYVYFSPYIDPVFVCWSWTDVFPIGGRHSRMNLPLAVIIKVSTTLSFTLFIVRD